MLTSADSVTYVFTDIPLLDSTVLTFLKNGLKLLKDKALEIIPKYRRTEVKIDLRVAERIIIFEILQLMLALYFKMLSVELSGLVLIHNFFEETYIYHLHAYLLACFYENHLKFLTCHIDFHLDSSVLWKQYQSVSQKMMEHICDLVTVKPQEILIKVCVIFYNIEICYQGCGEKASFLAII